MRFPAAYLRAAQRAAAMAERRIKPLAEIERTLNDAIAWVRNVMVIAGRREVAGWSEERVFRLMQETRARLKRG
jgi:hypothetical protein